MQFWDLSIQGILVQREHGKMLQGLQRVWDRTTQIIFVPWHHHVPKVKKKRKRHGKKWVDTVDLKSKPLPSRLVDWKSCRHAQCFSLPKSRRELHGAREKNITPANLKPSLLPIWTCSDKGTVHSQILILLELKCFGCRSHLSKPICSATKMGAIEPSISTSTTNSVAWIFGIDPVRWLLLSATCVKCFISNKHSGSAPAAAGERFTGFIGLLIAWYPLLQNKTIDTDVDPPT